MPGPDARPGSGRTPQLRPTEGASLRPMKGFGPVPSSVTVTRDVAYGEADGRTLLLDVYSGADGGPAVILIHGGAWRQGSKEAWERIAGRLANDGFVVFNVEYRLAPPGGTWRAPAAIDDVRTALTWVRANGSDFGADVSVVGAIGGSAGGNLALLLATTGEAGDTKADAVVSWSGLTDLPALASQAPNLVPVLLNYLGCSPQSCAEARAQSPLLEVDASDSPIYLANSRDEFIPLAQATAMKAALTREGVAHRLVVVPGTLHSEGYADQIWSDFVPWLKEALRL